MFALFCFVMAIVASPFKSKSRLEADNAALRHQLMVLRRKLPGKVRLTNTDRWFLVQLYRWFPSIVQVVTIVQPDTIVRWHRAGFRFYWRWKSRPRGGRPQIEADLRVLIRRMSIENPLWGAPRIHGELLKLGFEVAQSSVAKYMVKRQGPHGFAERLIGSIRRECVDHLIVLGEAHLRRILRAYARYYNEIRTHRSLDKDAPISRPVQRIGNISSRPSSPILQNLVFGRHNMLEQKYRRLCRLRANRGGLDGCKDQDTQNEGERPKGYRRANGEFVGFGVGKHTSSEWTPRVFRSGSANPRDLDFASPKANCQEQGCKLGCWRFAQP
jgi:hypothetical protein